ncbi:hypothetical protein BV898_16392 [Hypsibius exemplaris]|uniref:Uncharacterized protein n=1 Tax=Hypsibius exemplaris TaxID=2072580 RepID=A0A9X6NDC1_HYPEX|nr:hypothetical protein BV898_16392 [Hypsibius exemplaris]
MINEDILSPQSWLLKVTGYEPSTAKSRYLHNYPKLAASLRAIPAMLSSVYLFIATIAAVWVFVDLAWSPAAAHHTNDPTIITLVQNLVASVYPIRGAVVLLIFVVKRSAWTEVRQKIHILIKLTAPAKNAQTSRLRFLSPALVIATFSSHILFTTLMWVTRDKRFNRAGTQFHPDRERGVCFVDICFRQRDILFAWVPLVDVPFVLSQQVLLCSVLFAVYLVKLLKLISRDIQSEFEAQLKVTSGSGNLSGNVERWTFVYVECQRFMCAFNALFGWIWFVSVVLDFSTVLGCGSNILAGETSLDNDLTAVFVWMAVPGTLYITVLFLPFVLVNEEAKNMDVSLRHLLWIVKRNIRHCQVEGPTETRITFSDTKSDIYKGDYEWACPARLTDDLEQLTELVHENPLAMEAGGLYTFTRSFLVAVITTLATLLVLAQEILDRSRSAAACHSRHDLNISSAGRNYSCTPFEPPEV